jgi:putative endonuclease
MGPLGEKREKGRRRKRRGALEPAFRLKPVIARRTRSGRRSNPRPEARWGIPFVNLEPSMAGDFYVYIMANPHRTVLYTGVTRDLRARAFAHRSGRGSAFTKRYQCVRLVYLEILRDPYSAIVREKQIKAGSRSVKVELIGAANPEWSDLYEEL